MLGKESDQDGKQWIFGPFIPQLTLTYIIMGKKSLFLYTNIDISQMLKGGIEIYQTLAIVLLHVMCLNQQIRM